MSCFGNDLDILHMAEDGCRWSICVYLECIQWFLFIWGLQAFSSTPAVDLPLRAGFSSWLPSLNIIVLALLVCLYYLIYIPEYVAVFQKKVKMKNHTKGSFVFFKYFIDVYCWFIMFSTKTYFIFSNIFIVYYFYISGFWNQKYNESNRIELEKLHSTKNISNFKQQREGNKTSRSDMGKLDDLK